MPVRSSSQKGGALKQTSNRAARAEELCHKFPIFISSRRWHRHTSSRTNARRDVLGDHVVPLPSFAKATSSIYAQRQAIVAPAARLSTWARPSGKSSTPRLRQSSPIRSRSTTTKAKRRRNRSRIPSMGFRRPMRKTRSPAGPRRLRPHIPQRHHWFHNHSVRADRRVASSHLVAAVAWLTFCLNKQGCLRQTWMTTLGWHAASAVKHPT